MEEKIIIDLKNISLKFGDEQVLTDMNLYIRDKEFITLLGPSGCGKTTTLRIIAGFLEPDSGEVIFDNKNINGVPPHKRQVNTIFQRYALFPHLNVYENVAFGLRVKKLPEKQIKAKVDEVLAIVNLNNIKRIDVIRAIAQDSSALLSDKLLETLALNPRKDASGAIKTVQKILSPLINIFDKVAFMIIVNKLAEKQLKTKVQGMLGLVNLKGFGKRNVNSLSGGQQQRVAIARALVSEPRVLLLDEPLGALDLKLRKDMQVELKSIQQRLGITFIYVTHDQEEALSMSDTIVVMDNGVIQQIGTPLDIYNEPKNAFVADFIGESNILDGIMRKDLSVEFSGHRFKCLDSGFAKDELVDVVVRPEDVDVVLPEKGMISGTVTSVTFKGVHFEIIVDLGGFKWMIQNTDYQEVGTEIGLIIAPDDIQIMKKSIYSGTFGDYSSFSEEFDELSDANEEGE
ncbi:MAG: ABC transporter ATP-binding protein [Eubacteriales bacterium]